MKWTWTINVGQSLQLFSAIALLWSSFYAYRAWRRLDEAAQRYTRALVAMQEDFEKWYKSSPPSQGSPPPDGEAPPSKETLC
jgi:hypothetical protein